MARIEVEYSTQVRVAVGIGRESVDLTPGATLGQFLKELLIRRGEPLSPWLSSDGQPRPGLLVFVNDQRPEDIDGLPLQDGDRIALISLVSGG